MNPSKVNPIGKLSKPYPASGVHQLIVIAHPSFLRETLISLCPQLHFRNGKSQVWEIKALFSNDPDGFSGFTSRSVMSIQD
jgi:hypothetical protein